MIEARILIGQGDDERDCGAYKFVALPRVGENLILRLLDDFTPLRVVGVFHQPVFAGSNTSPTVVLSTERR